MERPNMVESSETEEGLPQYFVYSWKTKYFGRIQTEETLTHLRVDFSVKAIPKRAFRGCRALTHVLLPESLRRIGSLAFSECINLKCVQFISKNAPYSEINDNLEDGLIVFPRTVSAIGKGAFQCCHALRHIKLPPTLKIIEEGLCSYCERLEHVEIPTTVKEIDDAAFVGCSSLSHIRMPSRVSIRYHYRRIGMFAGCINLISIELPEGIPLEDLDIQGCRSLVNVAARIHVEPNFFPNLRLSTVVDNAAGLKFKLGHRFDNSPLNKLCYYQSYHSLEDAMVQLHSLMEDDPLAATTQVDEF
eukprot:scaffold14995_cov92-Cylindrotheca_fusiformis.AAC.6